MNYMFAQFPLYKNRSQGLNIITISENYKIIILQMDLSKQGIY